MMGRLLQRRLGTALMAGALAALTPWPGLAGTVTVGELSVDGSALGTMASNGEIDDLRFSVALGSDQPESTHVWAVVGGGRAMQRSTGGFWVPWNGDLSQLTDNHFTPTDGRIVFKALDGSLGTGMQGITIGIGYRVGGVMKYGIYGIVPAGSGS
jgi:hypothetical protein